MMVIACVEDGNITGLQRVGMEGTILLRYFSFYPWDQRTSAAMDEKEMAPHGTFLVVGAGSMRWHDIGFEPFMDIEFLLKESKRLLDLPDPGGSISGR